MGAHTHRTHDSNPPFQDSGDTAAACVTDRQADLTKLKQKQKMTIINKICDIRTHPVHLPFTVIATVTGKERS